MSFREMMMEKLKVNVAYKVANTSSVICEASRFVLEDLDYSDIASELNISSSDIADEIDSSDILSEVTGHLDMDEIASAVAGNCDMERITGKVISLLPEWFMDDLAVQAADEILAEMQAN